MSEINNLKFKAIREKNIAKRNKAQEIKTRKELSDKIKHDVMVRKNNYMRESNAALREVKLKKREFELIKIKDIKLLKNEYSYNSSINADVKSVVNSHLKAMTEIYERELKFYEVNYDQFKSAYALNNVYLIQNKIYTQQGQLEFLNSVSGQFNTAKKIEQLDKSIKNLVLLYKEKHAAALKQYKAVHDKKNAAIKKLISDLKNSSAKLINKSKNNVVTQQTLDQKIKRFDKIAQLNFEKTNKASLVQIEQLKRNAEQQIKKVEEKEKLAFLTNEEARIKIDEISLNSVQLQRKPNAVIQNNVVMNWEWHYKQKEKKILEAFEAEMIDFNKTKEVTAPITWAKKLKVSFDDFMSTHMFGKSLNDYKKIVSSSARKNSMLIILVIILVIFSITTNFKILNPINIYQTIEQNSFVFIIAMGMLMVIVAGYIDLSAGISYGFIAYLGLYVNQMIMNSIPVGQESLANMIPIITLIFMIIIGFLMGSVTGILVGYLKIPAFIATLSIMLILRGGLSLFGNGVTLVITPDSPWYTMVSSYIWDYSLFGTFKITVFIIFLLFAGALAIFSYLSRQKSEKYNIPTESFGLFLTKLLLSTFVIIGIGIWFALKGDSMKFYIVFFLIAILGMFMITKNLAFGRKVYAIGGNKAAAELSGINAKKTTYFIFAIAGAFTGYASFVFIGINYSATTSLGLGQELDVISAVFVGGASAYGGIGTVMGTVLGSFILSLLITGMTLSKVDVTTQFIIKGVILLAAVGYDVFSNRKIG